MDIYLTKNDSRTGPYNEAQILEMLQAGKASVKDLAWRQGLTTWVPLGEIVPYTPPPGSQVTLPVSRGLFRILVGVSLALFILLLVLGAVATFPEPLQTYNNTRFKDSSPIFAIFIGLNFLVLFGMMAASYIGLFLIHRWGRLVFTIAAVWGAVFSLFLGPDLQSALCSAANSFYDMGNGVLLGIAYFTPLFKRKTDA